jgi:hypothetical protein
VKGWPIGLPIDVVSETLKRRRARQFQEAATKEGRSMPGTLMAPVPFPADAPQEADPAAH